MKQKFFLLNELRDIDIMSMIKLYGLPWIDFSSFSKLFDCPWDSESKYLLWSDIFERLLDAKVSTVISWMHTIQSMGKSFPLFSRLDWAVVKLWRKTHMHWDSGICCFRHCSADEDDEISTCWTKSFIHKVETHVKKIMTFG